MGKKYSIFNNFNKNYHQGRYPNYFDEYVDEFSEELFRRELDGISTNTVKSETEKNKLEKSSSISVPKE